MRNATVIAGVVGAVLVTGTAYGQAMSKGTFSGTVVTYSAIAPASTTVDLVTGPTDLKLILTKICSTSATVGGVANADGVLLSPTSCIDYPAGYPVTAGEVVSCVGAGSPYYCLATGVLSKK